MGRGGGNSCACLFSVALQCGLPVLEALDSVNKVMLLCDLLVSWLKGRGGRVEK